MYLLSRQDGSGGAGGAPGGAPMLPPPVNLPADPTAAVIAITVIMFIIVVLKVGYRAFVVKHPQWDDLAAGLGALLTVAMTAVIVSVFNEAGLKHRALVSPIVVGAPQFTNRLFVYTLLSAVPNGFAKLAILSLLATVFPRIARPITAYFVYFGMAVVVLFYSILVIYTGVKCGPRNGVSCSVPTQVDLAKASTTVNLILDVYIMIISVWNIMSLQLTRRRKFGIVAVFLTGILALICSIIALYYRFTTSTEPNTAWTFILTPLVLAIYEPAIALIAACLPTYPALWKSTYNSPAFESVRNLLTSLTGSRGSFGSVELRDQPSHEHLHRPGTGASKPASKRSHETTTVDVATKSYSDERIRR